jgi:hypothetical protein
VNLFIYLFIYLFMFTPWSKISLEKLTSSQLSTNSQHFIKTEVSLPHLQQPATCPYPEPDQSSPRLHIALPKDPF